jgi:hypothetical protein
MTRPDAVESPVGRSGPLRVRSGRRPDPRPGPGRAVAAG